MLKIKKQLQVLMTYKSLSMYIVTKTNRVIELSKFVEMVGVKMSIFLLKSDFKCEIKIADITQHSLVSNEVVTHKENGKGITKTYELTADSKLEDVSIAGYKIVHKKVLKRSLVGGL